MTWPLSYGGLPVPWRGDSAAIDVKRVIAELEHHDPQAGSDHHDLLTALKHARYRAHEDFWTSPEHVRYAQAVLEIAVEWSMPAVERWAVAWLIAAGGNQFRLRWSSRSRDGKIRRDGLTASRINVLSNGPERVIIGCESGSVESWSNEAGLTRAGSTQSPVWAIAADKERIFAAGAGADFFATPQVGELPSLQKDSRLQVAGITAAALSPSGLVACGDEVGHVFMCRPGTGRWIRFSSPDEDARVLDMTFCSNSALRVNWRNGWVAEATCPPSGEWAWARRLERVGAPGIAAAVFEMAGQRLAIAEPTGVVEVVIPTSGEVVQAWIHPGVRSIAWSPDGLLATAGEEMIILGGPGTEPGQIHSEDAAGIVAFLGTDHLVAAQGPEVVQWAIREAGSDAPGLAGEDRITAVAVDPGDPNRSMAGTWQGRLLQFDGTGSLTPLHSGETIVGRVHQFARAGNTWLIAAQTGAFRWDPGLETAPRPLARRLCRAVAAPDPEAAAIPGQHGAFAANHEVRTLDGEPLFAFEGTVLDIRYGPGSCIAAIDQLGSVQARDPVGAHWRAAVQAGSRLLVAGTEAVIVRFPGGEVVEIPRYRQYRKLGQLPADTKAALSFDDRRVLVVCPGRGFGLAGIGEDAAGAPPTLGISTRAATAATDGRQIVVAAGRRIAGYDLLQSASATGDGAVTLAARISDGKCEITIPGGTVIRVPPQGLAALRATQAQAFADLLANFTIDTSRLWESAARLTIDGQSAIVSAAGRLAELIWQAGLDLAVDLARGDAPDRSVRLAWDCDDQSDELPWELVQPIAPTLGWFDDPPMTAVRTVAPSLSHDDLPGDPVSGPLARHTMLVIRGTGLELDSSDLAYQRTRRRTRRSNVRLLSAQPQVISEPGDLDRVLPNRADILQVWAHCGPREVLFSAQARFPAGELADRLAACFPRLVVLVGCQSGALGRALVRRGVAAVVAMRVEVYSHTIQPLVEDLVSLTLAGRPVDLAFADALRRYVLTGQPGAVAVPMLYLAADSSGTLFSPFTTAPSVLAIFLQGTFMTDTLVFHSSFDSTRFSAVHPADFPNLAQAQAEAVISLLLGRSLVVNNTYAFDSRSVLDLIAAILDARDRARKRFHESASAQERIDAASPLMLRWYAPAAGMDFLACCAEQLGRHDDLGTKFILSHWKAIDDENKARDELAVALTSTAPVAPPFIQQHPELVRSFDTLLRLNKYVASPGRGGPSGGPRVNLLDYLTDFEKLDNAELGRLVACMSYPIDPDKAAHLREAVRKVAPEVKKNRGWAHDAVNKAGGEEKCGPFLLEQRQLVDTLYNAVIADSVGSGSEFLSSVPRTVNNDNLKLVNGLALELIRYSKSRREQVGPAGQRPAGPLTLAPAMSGLFVAAAGEVDLPAAPLPTLLNAYWDMIADDDLSQPWQDSCAQLEHALREDQRLRQAGRAAGSQLSESWEAHLETLHARLPHIQDREKRLGAAIQLGAQAYCQLNLLNEADRQSQAESLATGEYIDGPIRKVA